VLLCPELIDLSELTDPTNYVLPGSKLSKKFSKCYYVMQDVYDAFLRTSSGKTFDLEAPIVPQSSPTSFKIRRRVESEDADEDLDEEEGVRSGASVTRGEVRVQLNLHESKGESGGVDAFLQCRLVEGKGLAAMDINGFSDPYALVYIVDDDGNKMSQLGTFRTPTVTKTLNP
jgi:hypothetical protein